MRKAILLASFFAASAVASADVVPFFTRCEVKSTLNTWSLVAEVGAGTATVACWDGFNNQYAADLNLVSAGAGAKIGACQINSQIQAVGVGFTFHELISAMAQLDLGSMMVEQASTGAAVSANPIGINADLRLVKSSYSSGCVGFLNMRGLVAVGQPTITKVN